MMQKSTPSSGFTLVELLVVITIIVLLLSMVTPGINNALERARIAGCTSNLRQQGIAAIGFAADNRQSLPKHMRTVSSNHRLWGSDNVGWERALAPYINAELPPNDLLATGMPVFICPSSSIKWDANLTHWGRGPGNYRHAGIPEAGGNNAYQGLYYNYEMSSQNQSNNQPTPQILNYEFYVSPTTQPIQWCSQRLSVDPGIDYNANTLSALGWHRRIRGRPVLFLDGRVVFLNDPIHNTVGEQTLVNASHSHNIQFNHLRGLDSWRNGGTYGLVF